MNVNKETGLTNQQCWKKVEMAMENVAVKFASRDDDDLDTEMLNRGMNKTELYNEAMYEDTRKIISQQELNQFDKTSKEIGAYLESWAEGKNED